MHPKRIYNLNHLSIIIFLNLEGGWEWMGRKEGARKMDYNEHYSGISGTCMMMIKVCVRRYNVHGEILMNIWDFLSGNDKNKQAYKQTNM